MISFSETLLTQWLGDYFWPFTRMAALITAAPVFNLRQIPARFKVALAIMVTVIIVPVLPPSPSVPLFSSDALLILLQQVAIGVAMGFVFQLAFNALVFGGQTMAYSMGLGFAHMMDPQNGVQVPVVSQYWLILAMLVFLLTNAHLLLIDLLVDSFQVVPIAPQGITVAGLWGLLAWSSRLFAAGLTLAMPVIVALLLTNIGLGFVTRAAPQLNIFAVGFPMTLTMGLVLMWLTLPSVLNQFNSLIVEAFEQVDVLLRQG
jgi:flagellar biosynthetic protein FliR